MYAKCPVVFKYIGNVAITHKIEISLAMSFVNFFIKLHVYLIKYLDRESESIKMC